MSLSRAGENKYLRRVCEWRPRGTRRLVERGFWPFAAIVVFTIMVFGGRAAGTMKEEHGFKTCISCHPEIKKDLSAEEVHRPFMGFECGSCHNPHATKHEGLIKAEIDKLCLGCHEDQAGELEKMNGHEPFRQGRCLACHKPHASDNERLLLSAGEVLCFECHSQEEGFSWKNKHAPVGDGRCLACHNSHASQHEALAKKPREAMCAECHSTGDQKDGAHLGYSVVGTDCMSCHNPHGADEKGLIRRSRHKPFGEERCRSCHNGPSAQEPLGIQGTGVSVCIECHPGMSEAFETVNSHVAGGMFCVNCHSPHASDQRALRKAKEAKVCYSCHEDTKRYVKSKQSPYEHPLLEKGQCTPCHRPHGTNSALFFARDEVDDCTACHERHATFTHPIGENAIDPRSGQRITCITCHNLMGSPNRFALRFDRKRELCIQCHKGY